MTRSRATARAAGTKWETEIVRALIAAGWPYAERRRLAGKRDRGDIAGVAGIVIEAKNTNEIRLAEAINEAHAEALNDNTGVLGVSHGVAWFKRKGKSAAEDGYVVMDGRTFMALLKEASY
jgi:hypothetical protein